MNKSKVTCSTFNIRTVDYKWTPNIGVIERVHHQRGPLYIQVICEDLNIES